MQDAQQGNGAERVVPKEIVDMLIGQAELGRRGESVPRPQGPFVSSSYPDIYNPEEYKAIGNRLNAQRIMRERLPLGEEADMVLANEAVRGVDVYARTFNKFSDIISRQPDEDSAAEVASVAKVYLERVQGELLNNFEDTASEVRRMSHDPLTTEARPYNNYKPNQLNAYKPEPQKPVTRRAGKRRKLNVRERLLGITDD